MPSNNDDLRVQLLSPLGHSIFFDNDDTNRGPFTLDEAGTYRLELVGNNGTIGDYAFSLYEPSTTFALLTLGTDVSGTIVLPGELDVFTFTGTAGQRLYYDALVSAADELLVNLISPSGRQIFFDNDDTNRGTFTLDEAGPYRLNLFGNNDATGDYHFRVIEPAATLAPLALGGDVTGTIALPGEVDIFTFTGTVGQRIYFDALPSAADDLLVNLVSPSGIQIFLDNDDTNRGPFTLGEAGPYRLNLFGSVDATGDYHFRVVEPVVTFAPLTLGTDVTGTLVWSGDLDVFTFTVSVGQQLYYDALASAADDLLVNLISPSGRQFFFDNDDTNRGPFTLDEAGPYRLNLFGRTDATGDYHFQLLDLSSQSLSPATPVTGTISPGTVKAFQHLGTRGQRLTFDSSLLGNADWILYGAASQFIAGNVRIGSDFTATLPADGKYTLLLFGDATNSVPFSFQVNDVSEAAVVPSGFGVRHVGSIAAGQTLSFSYNAPPALPVFFDSNVTSNFAALRIELRDPQNQQIFISEDQSERGPLFLDRAGTYTLTVSGDTPASTGDFNFTLLDLLNGNTALTLDATTSGDLIAFEAKPFGFVGSVGQRIFYDGLDADFDAVTATLYSSSGNLIFNVNSDDGAGPFTLTEAGGYLLLINNRLPSTSNFSFRITSPASTTAPSVIGTTISDSLSVPGDEKEYTFTGSVGQRIFYDALQNDFGGGQRAHLITPSGAILFNRNQDDNNGPFTLSEAGTYRLLMTGDNDATGTFSFRMLEPTFVSQPLTIGTTINDTLANPGNQKEYTFTGSIGQRIFYDALQNDFGAGQRATLIAPNGAILFNRNQDDNNGQFILSEVGTYRLLFSGDGDVTGAFRFRMLDAEVAPLTPFDQIVSGTLATGLGSEFFRIKGVVDERLYFDSFQAANIGWSLYGVDNVLVAGNGSFNDFETTLTQNANYVLELRSNSLTVDVPYQFRIGTPTTPTTPTTTTAAMSLNSLVTGTIAEPGETDVFTFAGALGQKLFYDSQQNDFAPINVRLVSPSGATLFNKNSDDESGPTFTLLETGTYRLIVDAIGELTGAYRFRLLNATAAPVLTLGTPVIGTLNPGLASGIFRLEGIAGQRVRFDFTTTAGYVWELDDPGDSRINSNTAPGLNLPVSLPSSGTYSLSIRGTDPAAAHDFGFTVTNISDAPVATSGLPITDLGNLTPSQQKTFTFTARAGTRVLLDSFDPDNDAASVELRDPANNIVFSLSASNDIGPVTLSRSGIYTFKIINSSAAVAADYNFRLVDLAAATVVLVNSTISETLSAPFETDLFTFNAITGQRLYLDARETNLGLIRQQLIGPDGQTIFDTTTDISVGPFTISTSGRYTLLVGGTETAAGNYSFRLFDAGAAPIIAFNTLITDATIQGVEADVFRFTGQANQLISSRSSPLLPSSIRAPICSTPPISCWLPSR